MTEHIIGWKLTITASAETRPGTPEEIELSKWRVHLVEQNGIQVLDPDPPAADETTCRDCNTWHEYDNTPSVYGWFATCPPTCQHGCHAADSVPR